jgi:hypothetical protein
MWPGADPVLEDNQRDPGGFPGTKAIVGFPADRSIPKTPGGKPVKASIKVMEQKKAWRFVRAGALCARRAVDFIEEVCRNAQSSSGVRG